MGDGYYTNNYVIFCTDNFTFEEVNLLRNILCKKFGLTVAVVNRTSTPSHIKCWRLRVSSSSVPLLIHLVKPHMIPEMYYKLGINS